MVTGSPAKWPSELESEHSWPECPPEQSGGTEPPTIQPYVPPTLKPDWEKPLQEALHQLAAAVKHSEGSRIDRLEQRVMILEQSSHVRLAALIAENQPVFTKISSLGIPGHVLDKPIPVTIRQDGDEFIATFFDANISTGGDTQQEAVTNLQNLIADFYDELAVTPQEELGPSLQRQKHVLGEFVCRT